VCECVCGVCSMCVVCVCVSALADCEVPLLILMRATMRASAR
jgi:hypothetical protein